MNLWKQILDRLEQTVDRTEYENWFASTRFLAQRGDTIDVSVPSQRYIEEIRERFGPRIRSILDDISFDRLNLHLVAASKSIAENPSGSFNPLFIYGGAGLGKTHLIQAVAQQIRELNPSFKVIYMSADAFVTELIASIRYDRMQQFRDRYRSADAMLLDDIQFLAGKERTQEEFFH